MGNIQFRKIVCMVQFYNKYEDVICPLIRYDHEQKNTFF